MSYQQQQQQPHQPPFNYGNAFPPGQMPPAANPVTSPTDPYNRFMPPTMNGQQQQQHQNGPPASLAPPFVAQKATLAPPQQQQQPQLRQQVLTNGTGAPPNSSANSSRTASPALNPHVNAAYLPPSSTPSQPSTSTASTVSPAASAAPPQPPSSQPITQGSAYAPPTAINGHQQQQLPPAPLTNGHPNVNHLTTNMQNINLSNGPSATQQPAANRAYNANAFAPKPQAPPVNSPLIATTPNAGPFASKPVPFAQPSQTAQPPPTFNGLPPQANQPRPPPTQAPSMPPTSANQYAPVQNLPPTSQYQPQQYNNANQNRPPPLPNQPAFNPNLNNNNNQPPMPGNAFPPQANQTNQAQPSQPPTIGKRPMYPTAQPINQQPTQTQYANGQTAQYQQTQHAQQHQFQAHPDTQYHQYPSNQHGGGGSAGGGGGVIQQGFNKLWGQNTIDLMQNRHILPTTPIEAPHVQLNHQFFESVNCHPE